MSVRNALLAIVGRAPAGVYRLRQAFEEQTGGAWPLNIGQAYQTMQRLERDGLVESHPETNEGRDSSVFTLTEAGREQLHRWWAEPVARDRAERDELVIKLAVAAADPSVDLPALIERQRRASLQTLRDVTRLRTAADDADLAWRFVVDRHVFQLEAEVRWLDHIESGVVAGELVAAVPGVLPEV